MKKNVKTKEELSLELNELKKENANLKALYEKEINRFKQAESMQEPSGVKPVKVSNTSANRDVTLPDEQSIRQLFDDYLRMYAGRDDLLTTWFSENFSGFTGGGDFLVKDKAEWVAITRQDFNQIKDPIRIELKDLALQPLSDTIVVTTGFFKIHLPIKDHILSRETARLVLIFRKEPAGWKISHSSISIPYYLVREGEVYPMKELVERNQLQEELIAERTIQLSRANDNLLRANEELAREIAERKQTEEALKQSNQKWEAIISASPDGIGMISLDGKMQLISDKLAEMFGYSIEEKNEFIGKPAFDFIDPSNRQMLEANFSKLLSGEKYHNISEYLAIKKDNSRFYVDLNSTILHDSNGNPASILFVERDITERKKAEEALQQSIQKWEAIIAASPDGIGMISLDGKIQLISDKLAEMFGYSVEQKNELLGKSSFDFIDPSNHKMMADDINEMINGKSDHKIKEYMAIKRDNNRFYADINSTLLLDSNGSPASILFVERDISERKQAELIIQQQNRQLKELNATKDKFFSILAHDLRSPLQGFMGITELIAEDIASFSLTELSKLTKEMNSTANNLYKLLSNLLDWAQMQEGAISFNPKEIILSEVVSQNMDMIIKSSEQKGITITTEVDDKQIVYADESMLNSILRNLLSNAVKFTERGGIVNVSSKETGNKMIEISVTDNGIGIPNDIYVNLFKMEEKVGRPGTSGEGSTGLGLLLCKEFVEKNGGIISVKSRENIGSTFYFTLQSGDKS